MQIVKVLIMVLIFNSGAVYAQNSLFERATNLLRRVMGRKDRVVHLKMPAIPEVKKDSTSLETSESYKDPNAKRFKAEDKKRYDYFYIKEVYEVTLQRKVNENELARWMNVIGQGGTREGVYRAIVLGSDYRAMENYVGARLRKKTIAFVEHFLSRYLQKKISTKDLKRINFYTVKRIVTEMALEVVDSFLMEKRSEDLFTWYGIMAADFAKNYSEVWDSKQRKNANELQQKKWAQAVPVQFLKSEIIIRIHKLMNVLNKH